MDLKSALKCITNSSNIKNLDAIINLTSSIESEELDELKIDWSKLGRLAVESEADNYIDKISGFNGILNLKSVKINSLSGNLERLDITEGNIQSEINFEDNTSIKDAVFRINLLNNKGYNPYIENAVISNAESFAEGDTFENKEGFLSKAENISCGKDLYYPYFKSLGYLTKDNEVNTTWPKVSVIDEDQPYTIQEKSLIKGKEFYKNLVFYVTNSELNSLTLDYIDSPAEDEDDEGYKNIVVPASITSDYIPENEASQLTIDPVDGIHIILGDYCFCGISSTDTGAENAENKRLYLTFDEHFIFNDSTITTSDNGVETEIKLSTKPFAENTFLTRSNAIQQININIAEKRPGVADEAAVPDDDIKHIYFSDFFTTCTKTTTIVDNGDGTTSENVDTTFEFDESTFNLYKDQLLAMVNGVADNLIFASQYQDIEAIIDADA